MTQFRLNTKWLEKVMDDAVSPEPRKHYVHEYNPEAGKVYLLMADWRDEQDRLRRREEAAMRRHSRRLE